MWYSMTFKRTVVGVLTTCILAAVACGKHDGDKVAAPDPPPKPDVIDDDGGKTGYVWLAGNAWHERRVDELMARPDVSGTVAAFEARGFEPAPEQSFTVTGTDGESSVSVTFLSLAHTGGPSPESATLACYEAGGELGLSAILTTTDAATARQGWQPLAEGVWYRDAGREFVGASAARLPPDWWDWGFFMDCILSRAPSVAVQCVLTCLGSTLAFGPCMLICTFSQAAAEATGCAITMYQNAQKKKKEQ